MALSANVFYEARPRGITRTAAHRVTDALKIWFNASVGVDDTSGLLIPYDGAVATIWKGISTEERTGDAALASGDPDANCIVDESGPKLKVTVTGVTSAGDHGSEVFWSDDGTVVLANPSTLVAHGYIEERVSGEVCWVQFLSAEEWFAKKP